MTTDEIELAFGQTTRTVSAIEKLRIILRNYIDDNNGAVYNRERFVAISIIERFYYNCISAAPLIKDFVFNKNVSVAISHIFRGLAYEIILGYWLLEKDFEERIAIVNNDFVKKNYKNINRLQDVTNEKLQQLMETWKAVSPENFKIGPDGKLAIRTDIKRFVFNDTCDYLILDRPDLEPLTFAYIIFSQQAHFSEFSRFLVVEKFHHNVGVFDTVIRQVIHSCIWLIQKTGDKKNTISLLTDLLDMYPK